MNVADIWYYDETSESCLRWKISVYRGRRLTILVVDAGDEAGSINGHGYYNVGYNNKKEAVHCIIWKLFNKEIPFGFEIDHLDGNRLNNNISNLFLKTRAGNTRNRSKFSNNTSNVTGVSLHQEKYWKAQWYDNHKVCTKYFSIATYGSDTAKQLAMEYRESQINRLRSLGCDYTERHGT